jgi:hypothetical protein
MFVKRTCGDELPRYPSNIHGLDVQASGVEGEFPLTSKPVLANSPAFTAMQLICDKGEPAAILDLPPGSTELPAMEYCAPVSL